MTADKAVNAYIPLPLPIWGIPMGGGLHINSHMNFIFHIERGYIIGAAAYCGTPPPRTRAGASSG